MTESRSQPQAVECGAAAPAKSPAAMPLAGTVALRFVLIFAIASAIVFFPAGTLRFWQGWALLAAFFLPTLCGFAYLLFSDPEVVRRRLETKEPVAQQKRLMRWFKPAFLVAFLIPGFDFRWGWSRNLLVPVPLWLTVLALLLVVSGFVFVFWVVQVNRFAASTIRVEVGQQVISNGPYALVRHPLYSGSALLFLSMPLALGSWVALPFFALLLPFYTLRLLNEEKLLRAELPGYTEYCQKTRYRLVPLVW